MSKNKFPKTLYVELVNEGTKDEFLNSVADFVKLNAEDGGRIGIYEFKKFAYLKRTASLERPSE